MAREEIDDIEFWDVLEDAEQTVERWPLWQQRHQADIYAEDNPVSWDISEYFGAIQ